jgi:hypothetical protein
MKFDSDALKAFLSPDHFLDLDDTDAQELIRFARKSGVRLRAEPLRYRVRLDRKDAVGTEVEDLVRGLDRESMWRGSAAELMSKHSDKLRGLSSRQIGRQLAALNRERPDIVQLGASRDVGGGHTYVITARPW